MPEYDFEQAIKGELTGERLDALFEAGCDDAIFSTAGGVVFAAFDREAPSPKLGG